MGKAIINYWTWKDSEIADELKQYDIVMEEYDRKTAITLLKRAVMDAGKAEEILIEEMDEDDEIKAVGLGDLKAEHADEEGVLMLSRIIFHNTGESDLPYVFIGHNARAFYVPKEIEVDVPDYLLDSVIKDAIEFRMAPQTMQDGTIKWISRRVQRFPYSIIKKSFPAP